MKFSKLPVVAMVAFGVAGYGSVAFADAAAGKKTFDDVCAECHETGDFEGESAKDIAATIDEIVAGKKKHKEKLTLTAQQAADVAAFITGGK
jgi:mono/diheme cytochrome c family protein